MTAQFIISPEGCIAKVTEEDAFLLFGGFLRNKRWSFFLSSWWDFGHIDLKSARDI
jgi:hypothetical protein